MANFKRGRRKNARAGCLYCKPHKHQRAKDSFESQTRQEQLALTAEQPERHRKKGGKRKRWAIEVQQVCTQERADWLNERWSGQRTFKPAAWGWDLYRRYASKRDRDNALAALKKREEALVGQNRLGPPFRDLYQYRAGPEPT